ncbi:MAG: 2-succinylbenzoate--CoA ligase [Elainellaceae cyanobacterium]
MVSPLESYLESYRQRRGTPWLNSHQTTNRFEAAFERRYGQLSQLSNPPVAMLAERSPALFLASFLAACAAKCPIFLANPGWPTQEWEAAVSLAQPNVIWREGEAILSPERCAPEQGHDADLTPPGWIMIPTGGTSGRLKFAIHTWETLSASVWGFCQYFAPDASPDVINACCTLPLYHVSGLMQFMRCWLSGGQMVIQPWRSLTRPLAFAPETYFLSLVPSQLQELLTSPTAIIALKRFRAVLLGGAPAWPSLLDQGRSLGIPLAPTYGMTETASQVATLKPEQFLTGQTGCGLPLPHAKITIGGGNSDALGEPGLQVGPIAIAAQSLYLGYYPHASRSARIETDDLGYLDAEGLHIVGRRSDMIISGGENIFPAEVEAAIRATGLVEDVVVTGAADPRWGETPVALYVPRRALDARLPEAIRAALSPYLSRYKYPSRWISLSHLPRTPQGKLDRAALRKIAGVRGSNSRLEKR